MLTLMILLPLAAAQSSPSTVPPELIAGLIDSTDRLKHFSAVYRMKRDGEQAELLIDYVAPDSLNLRVHSPEEQMSTVIDGDEIWMSTSGGDGVPTQGAIDWLDRGGALEEAQRLLAELAPLRAGIPQVFVRLDWGTDSETQETVLSFSVGRTMYGEIPLLGWLESFQHPQGELTLKDGMLIYGSERVSAVVDANTGFLTELNAAGLDDSVVQLTLQSLDLDSAPARDVFVQPEAAEGARDISDGLENIFRSRSLVRAGGLHRFQTLVKTGRREMDDKLLHDLRCFMLALHRPQLQAWVEKHLEALRVDSDAFGGYLSSQLAGGAPIETLEEEAAQRRQSLTAWLDEVRGKRLGELPADPESMADSLTWKQLRAAEDEVFLQAFGELFSTPVLADFDAAVQRALGSSRPVMDVPQRVEAGVLLPALCQHAELAAVRGLSPAGCTLRADPSSTGPGAPPAVTWRAAPHQRTSRAHSQRLVVKSRGQGAGLNRRGAAPPHGRA